MEAYYYKIVEFNELSKKEGEIIEEGIIRNSEDTIYPQQTTGIEELPYECEAHHFEAKGYELEGFYINIPSSIIYSFKVR